MTALHVGLCGPANPVPVDTWPDQGRSPRLILCGPGAESPPGTADTSRPLVLVPLLLIGQVRSDQAIPRSTRSISLLNVAGAFTSPKGVTLNSWSPPCVTKAVFSRSAASISTCQYPLARSRLQKNLAPPRVLRLFSM